MTKEDLEERINKAIKLIEEKCMYQNSDKICYTFLTTDECKEIYLILKGEDKK